MNSRLELVERKWPEVRELIDTKAIPSIRTMENCPEITPLRRPGTTIMNGSEEKSFFESAEKIHQESKRLRDDSERKCNVGNISTFPFWYLGDYETPELPFWQSNPHEYLGNTIFDIHLAKTLQTIEKQDAVTNVNMDKEGIVPGHALEKQCTPKCEAHSHTEECAKIKEKWLNDVRNKIKRKLGVRKYEKVKDLKSSLCYDPFYGSVPKPVECKPKELTYEEWLVQDQRMKKGSTKNESFHGQENNQPCFNYVEQLLYDREKESVCPWKHKFRHTSNLGCMKLKSSDKEVIVPLDLSRNIKQPRGGFLQDYQPSSRHFEGYWAAPISTPLGFRTSLNDAKSPFWPYFKPV